ncbi:TPA: hypothetical protein ACHOWV_005565, partial [Escherichia coli]
GGVYKVIKKVKTEINTITKPKFFLFIDLNAHKTEANGFNMNIQLMKTLFLFIFIIRLTSAHT